MLDGLESVVRSDPHEVQRRPDRDDVREHRKRGISMRNVVSPRSTCRYSTFMVQRDGSANSTPPPIVHPVITSDEEPAQTTSGIGAPRWRCA